MTTRRPAWPGLGALGLGAALGLACGGGAADLMNSTSGDPVEVPPWACVPGESRSCDCPDLPGIQTCNAEGSAFGDCDCSPGAVSQGPPPTSTGTGTGSESGTADDTGSDTGPGPTTDDPTTMGPGSTTDPDPSTTSGMSTGPGGGSTGGSSTG